MKKTLLILTFIILTSSCGFTPIYKSKGLENFNLEVLEYRGDRNLNNLINFNFKKFNNFKDNNKDKFTIIVTSNYKKIILSKNKSGTAEQYSLLLEVSFDVSSKNLKEIISYQETFNIKNIDNQYDENKYEQNLKENFIKKTTQSLILDLRRLNNDN